MQPVFRESQSKELHDRSRTTSVSPQATPVGRTVLVRQITQTLPAVLALVWPVLAAYPDELDVEVGLRANVLLGDGVPANDILGIGVVSSFDLRDGWFAATALDAYAYDFERPSSIVGIPQDPSIKDIDASATSVVLSAHLGRRSGVGGRGFRWFWMAGLGVGFPHVGDVAGPTADGGTFDMTFDAGTELHVMGTFGTSYYFTPTWSATAAARVEHHFMDIRLTDRVSGATASIDSQSPVGAFLAVNYAF